MHDLSLGLTIAIALVFIYEFVNGFHDTANAVATVIYTHSLRPIYAVILSGICNFLGAVSSNGAVAFGIVSLFPFNTHSDRQWNLVIVLSILGVALFWNLSTWYFGLPISSTHGLIGTMAGMSLVHSDPQNWLASNTWHSLQEILISLCLSPLIGFIGSALLLLCINGLLNYLKTWQPDHQNAEQKEEPSPETATIPESNSSLDPTATANDHQPPLGIRALLIITCSGVSFAHGSNDGQKGVGLMMLVLALTLPDRFVLDRLAISASPHLPPADIIPIWVKIFIAIALGLGTMIGWRRIVTTIGEKIGKEPMTYAQGATAQFITMLTINIASYTGMPVSTTQILSSSIVGTMAATHTKLDHHTLRNLVLAWLLTLPCCMMLGYLAGYVLSQFTKM
ncbi:MAG: inorganic phosphate transporter [Pseudanabaenaceae cyanobacterium bins.39]|nr:inorganic phosphate transporter [Pseudanabaenaceae cyanobacterium bins.39]